MNGKITDRIARVLVSVLVAFVALMPVALLLGLNVLVWGQILSTMGA